MVGGVMWERQTQFHESFSALVARLQKLKLLDMLRRDKHESAAVQDGHVNQILNVPLWHTQTPAYVSRSTLEDLMLRQTQSLVWGIRAVVVDYARSGTSNWRVVGFANGNADREAAAQAVASATCKYAAWVMVEDTDPRANARVPIP